MQPQQPYGYQQPYPQPPQQAPQPNPYGQQYQQVPPPPYAQPRPQWWGAPAGEPSGITTLAAAVLGLLIGLTWIASIVASLVFVDEIEMSEALATGGVACALALPSLIGAVGLFARRGFGRWFLVVGLGLAALPSGFVVVASFFDSPGPPQWLLLAAASILVFSLGGIVLAVSPTTGRHLRAVKQATAQQPGYPVQQPYGYPQQAMHPQQAYPQQPGCPPHY